MRDFGAIWNPVGRENSVIMAQGIEVLFSFPRRKMLNHLFLSPPLCFNHPELLISTVLENNHMWKYIFKNSILSGSFAFPRRVKGPLYFFPKSGEGVEFKMQVRARNESTHIQLSEAQPLWPSEDFWHDGVSYFCTPFPTNKYLSKYNLNIK